MRIKRGQMRLEPTSPDFLQENQRKRNEGRKKGREEGRKDGKTEEEDGGGGRPSSSALSLNLLRRYEPTEQFHPTRADSLQV